MFTKTILLSSSLIITSYNLETANYCLNNQKNFNINNLNEYDQFVVNNKLMNQQEWNIYKDNLMKINRLLMKANYNYTLQYNLQTFSSLLYNHIFKPSFWFEEFSVWWGAASLHIQMSTLAIEQFFELITNGADLTATLIGANVIFPVWGTVLIAYLVANIVAIRHIDKGNGVTLRFLFALIPTGYWAN